MFDSHCHLAGEEFAADLDAVVERARGAGLTGALCILAAGDAAESARARRVREAWPAVRFAAGVHPHQAGTFHGRAPEAADVVRQAVEREQACAIGEIGLDYHYDFAPRETQRDVFAAQVRLARVLDLPIVIHTREATDDTLGILRDEGGGAVRGVFHCFTGGEAEARAALDIGFHVSFAGILTFPKAEAIRAAARIVPLDRVLAETDSPYLAPVPYRGKRNEPAHVVKVAETLAAIHGIGVAEMAEQVARNVDSLFGSAANGVLRRA